MSKEELFTPTELADLIGRPRSSSLKSHPLWSVDPAVEMALDKLREEQREMMAAHVRVGMRSGMWMASAIATLFITLFTIDVYILFQLR